MTVSINPGEMVEEKIDIKIPRPPMVGSRLVLTDVEKTLIGLQHESACAYYEGKIAELKNNAKNNGGGLDK